MERLGSSQRGHGERSAMQSGTSPGASSRRAAAAGTAGGRRAVVLRQQLRRNGGSREPLRRSGEQHYEEQNVQELRERGIVRASFAVPASLPLHALRLVSSYLPRLQQRQNRQRSR